MMGKLAFGPDLAFSQLGTLLAKHAKVHRRGGNIGHVLARHADELRDHRDRILMAEVADEIGMAVMLLPLLIVGGGSFLASQSMVGALEEVARTETEARAADGRLAGVLRPHERLGAGRGPAGARLGPPEPAAAGGLDLGKRFGVRHGGDVPPLGPDE